MCCIFTCCGWMIDLVQRFVTFSMTCCVSNAVCCLFITACMSGIALGYNYSLAEYIDLKETNVSVYLKRGVFDDEVADDFSWRRSGRLPVEGQNNDDKLVTGADADDDDSNKALRSGPKLSDSLYESEDNNKFEGSLIKLTRNFKTSTETMRSSYSDNYRKQGNTNSDISMGIYDAGDQNRVTRTPAHRLSGKLINELNNLRVNSPVQSTMPNFKFDFGEDPLSSGEKIETLVDSMKNLKSPQMQNSHVNQQPPQEQPTQNENEQIENQKQNGESDQSGRRAYMSDYDSMKRIPMVFSGRRGGQVNLRPIDIFNKEQLDSGVDRDLTPPPIIRDKQLPQIFRTATPPGLVIPQRSSTEIPKEFVTRTAKKNEDSLDEMDLQVERRNFEPKSNPEDYIEDDIDKVPLRRKKRVIPLTDVILTKPNQKNHTIAKS